MVGKKSSNFVAIISILSLLFIIAFIFSLQLSMEDSLEENSIENYEKKIIRPPLNLEKNNGIVTNIWFEDKKQLEKFVENDIKYLFVDVGDIDKNGKLITEENELRHFLDFIGEFEKEMGYDFMLLPYNEIIIENSEIYDFTKDFTNNIVNNHKRLIGLGFDGAYIDVEAIPFDKRNDYLKFLEKLDEVIGNEYILAVSSGSLDEKPNIWEWEPTFYTAVSDRTDIILISSYDFNLKDKEEYQTYVKNQIKSIASKEWGANFMFIAPTHKQWPETIENSLDVFNSEILKYPNNEFIGITIFAEWTTDNREWESFGKYI